MPNPNPNFGKIKIPILGVPGTTPPSHTHRKRVGKVNADLSVGLGISLPKSSPPDKMVG